MTGIRGVVQRGGPDSRTLGLCVRDMCLTVGLWVSFVCAQDVCVCVCVCVCARART